MGTYWVESLNCVYIFQTVKIIWFLFMVYHLYNFYHSHESKDSIRTEVHHLLHGVWVNFTRRTDTRHILDHTLNAGFTEPVSTGSLHWFMEGGQTDGAEVLPVKIRAERSIIAPRALRGSGHLKRTQNLQSIGELQRQQGHRFWYGGGVNSISIILCTPFVTKKTVAFNESFVLLNYGICF